MHPNADIFLALRYLRPKRTFISVITLLSVLGPVLGVALLVIVTAVMSGFDRDIRSRILGMQAHLHILPTRTANGGEILEDPGPILKKLRALGARGAPVIEGPVLLQWKKQVLAKFVKGIVPERERQVSNLAESVRGRFDIEDGEALIGEEMAAQLGLRLGDHLLIHAPARLTRGMHWTPDGRVTFRQGDDEAYLPEEVTIVGIFSMGLYEYDSSIVILTLDQAAELFGYDWGAASSVQARTPDPFHLDTIENSLRKAFPDCRVLSWQEANRRLFGALRVEKNLMSFLLFFIVVVAAFGISGTLITVAVQKTREIGILKAVGMTAGTEARIFVIEGALIGVAGTALGMGTGLLVIHFRDRIAALLSRIMGVEVFPKELYHLTSIPARIVPADLGRIAILAVLICIVGALIPALYASALSPAAALHEEN